MAKQNEHGRIIAAAAKAALGPIGCKRQGQSRTWISDEGFYAIVIEFQPSGWSKGSYLNVGSCWLWHISRSWTFDEGYRVADFIPFEDAGQFTPLIEAMGQRAAEEILAIRETFKTLGDVARVLSLPGRLRSHGRFHAAIAAGLIGYDGRSPLLFRVRGQGEKDGLVRGVFRPACIIDDGAPRPCAIAACRPGDHRANPCPAALAARPRLSGTRAFASLNVTIQNVLWARAFVVMPRLTCSS